jgi:hypothetical protein
MRRPRLTSWDGAGTTISRTPSLKFAAALSGMAPSGSAMTRQNRP